MLWYRDPEELPLRWWEPVVSPLVGTSIFRSARERQSTASTADPPPTEAPELFPNFFSCLSLGPPAYLAAGLPIGSYLTMSIKLSAVFIDHFDAPAL